MLGFQKISWPCLIPWMPRAWSLIALALLSVAYFLCLRYFTDVSAVNKYYGAILQIIGGASVLFAINKNLNIFRSKTVWQLIIEWAKEFPIKRVHHITLSDSITATDSVTCGSISQTTPPNPTIDERIKAIERDILHIMEDLKLEVQRMKSEIENFKSKLEKNINHTSSRMEKFDTNLKAAMAGDIQSPILGVLLAMIGTVMSLFS